MSARTEFADYVRQHFMRRNPKVGFELLAFAEAIHDEAREERPATPATYTEVERLDRPGNRADLRFTSKSLPDGRGLARPTVPASPPLDVERLARALDELSDEGLEYDLMAPEERDERYEVAERLAAAYGGQREEGRG